MVWELDVNIIGTRANTLKELQGWEYQDEILEKREEDNDPLIEKFNARIGQEEKLFGETTEMR